MLNHRPAAAGDLIKTYLKDLAPRKSSGFDAVIHLLLPPLRGEC